MEREGGFEFFLCSDFSRFFFRRLLLLASFPSSSCLLLLPLSCNAYSNVLVTLAVLSILLIKQKTNKKRKAKEKKKNYIFLSFLFFSFKYMSIFCGAFSLSTTDDPNNTKNAPPPFSSPSKLGVLPPGLLRRRKRVAPDPALAQFPKVEVLQVDLLKDRRVRGADAVDAVAVVAERREGGPLDYFFSRSAGCVCMGEEVRSREREKNVELESSSRNSATAALGVA